MTKKPYKRPPEVPSSPAEEPSEAGSEHDRWHELMRELTEAPADEATSPWRPAATGPTAVDPDVFEVQETAEVRYLGEPVPGQQAPVQEPESLLSQDTHLFRDRGTAPQPFDAAIHDASTAIVEAVDDEQLAEDGLGELTERQRVPAGPVLADFSDDDETRTDGGPLADFEDDEETRADERAALGEELHSTAELEPRAFPPPQREITHSLVARPSFASEEILLSSQQLDFDPDERGETAAAPSPVAELAAREQGLPFGSYRLLRRLKAGGMGEVYQGIYTSAAGVVRPVAIKRILLPFMERDVFVHMFIDEAKLTVQLSHADIVQVLELGRYGDEYFIAMDYVDGRDLATLLRSLREREEVLAIPVALHIAHHVLEALDHAHRKRDAAGRPLGIVHRDVSPPNIMCSFEGQVKLTDFGVAKVTSKLERTRPGLLVGKLAYMSPEQLRSQPVDHRSDIFAAAIVLHELLTGEPLFAADSEIRTVVQILEEPIPSVRSRRGEVPEVLDAIVMRGLERDPSRRYQWASEMSEAIQHFMLEAGYSLPAMLLTRLMDELYAGEPAGSPL